MALKSPAVQSSETDENLIDYRAVHLSPLDFISPINFTSVPAAARAVDGNRDPAQTSTCTTTKSEPGPWWMVDLQNEYKINAIAVTSSDSNQAPLDGVEIRLGISKLFNDSKNVR